MTDQDIERWTAEWRAGAPPVADLARMAKRERRLLSAWIAFDWLVGVGLLVFAVWMWLAIGTAPVGFAAISIWVLTIVVLGFTVINWRGMLAADRGSAAEFLAYAVAAKPGTAALHPLWLEDTGRRHHRGRRRHGAGVSR